MNKFTQIGIVKNRFKEPEEPGVIRAEESVIEVFEEFAEGLYRIEESEYLDVLFIFDRSESFNLIGTVYSGEVKGLFASRSPNRPTPIGLSTVKLVERKNNILTVSGLDALNGSPVIDIKPFDRITDKNELEVIRFNNLKANPRYEIKHYIENNHVDRLLIMAAQMHGHFCPGLALGIMAGIRSMQKMDSDSDGLEEILAIVETNNCFSDGIQFVTGCSFGNNALIFKDVGKIACSVINRNGNGIRIVLKPEAREIMHSVYPDFSDSYDEVVSKKQRDPAAVSRYKEQGLKKALAVLDLNFDQLFDMNEISGIIVPEFAPSHESYPCSGCGENTMSTRTVAKDGQKYCLDCTGETIHMLTGYGIDKA